MWIKLDGGGENMVHHRALVVVRGLKVLSEFMSQFSGWIDSEYPRNRYPHSTVSVSIICSVTITSKEGILPPKKRLDISETSNFKFFWISIYNFLPEALDQTFWIEEKGTIRQSEVPLSDGLQVFFGDCGLTYGPGAQIHDVVAVVLDLVEQLGHAALSPILANDREDVAEDIRLGDGSINVADHNFAGVFPQEDMTFALCSSLKGRGDAELNLVAARLQIQLFNHIRSEPQSLFELPLFLPSQPTIITVVLGAASGILKFWSLLPGVYHWVTGLRGDVLP